MFGLNCLWVRTKSRVNAIMTYHIKGAQLLVCLLIYESRAYFYVIRSIKYIFHSVFTYLSVFCDVASKSSSVVAFINKRLAFSMVRIKQNI
jgi:hypothetical protein